MYQIKKEYLGKGAVVSINRPDWAIQNINTVINLDCATQMDMARLFEIGHPAVEKIDSKKSKE